MKLAKIAAIIAFVIAGLGIMDALTRSVYLLPAALLAGIGVFRRRVWGAYSLAIFLLAQMEASVLFRNKSPNFVALTLLTAILVLLVFLGRSLAASGEQRGMVWPWIVLSVITTLPIFFVQAFVHQNGSMENTLLVGDGFLVQRFPRPSVKRGDLIAFRYPIDRNQTSVKRVIGVPGDRIKIVEKFVYVNGAVLKEPYVVHKSDYPDSYRDNLPSEPTGPYADAARDMLKNNVVNGEVVVPTGKYFVLGDNRDNSLDSRYWGFVGSSDVIGKPLLIYDSEDKSNGLPRRRWGRFLKVL